MSNWLPNVLCLAGLCGIGGGLWLIHPAAAAIGAGALSACAGVYLTNKKAKGGKK